MSTWRRLYGASPLHLAAHAAAFAAAGYAFLRILERGPVENFLIWFVGAALLHDLVLLPAYSLLDRGARRTVRIPSINYLRVPALISGRLLRARETVATETCISLAIFRTEAMTCFP